MRKLSTTNFRDETHHLISLEDIDTILILTLPNRGVKARQILPRIAPILRIALILGKVEMITSATTAWPDMEAKGETVGILLVTERMGMALTIVVEWNVGAIPPGPRHGGNRGNGGDGGGSDGGGGGGRNGIDQRFPYITPGAPYRTMVPTIEPKLKVETLPEWDGDPNTAIDYFWDVGEMATLMGWVPKALGFWLPSRLKKGSPVQMWFSTLSRRRQASMRERYLTYLQVIKDRYLGRKWQLRMNIEFEQQSFRQRGHEEETPQGFLSRRIRSVRILANSDDGGPLKVFLVMRKAPIKWSMILVLENIQTSEELFDKINEHDEELVEAVRGRSPEAITVGNLVSTLCRLGYQQNPTSQRANRAEAEVGIEDAGADAELMEATFLVESSAEDGANSVKQAYQALKKRQRPLPKGGYPFSRNDHVTTKMGKAPPSPCKVCGSPNHWDRECPDWNVYIERQKRGTLTVMVTPASDEAELLYHSAYCVLLEG
jgi:hypothetical protein